jgi:hypothetical protein
MKVTKTGTARNLLAENPNITAKQLAEKMGIKEQYAYGLLWKLKQSKRTKKMGRPKKIDVEIKARNAKADMQHMLHSISRGRGQVRMGRPPMRMMELFTSNTSISDAINHPAHYKVGGIETIDFIEAKKLGYNLGNVVKYVTRAGHKGNRKEDLEKARWYLNRELENLSKK